MVEIRITQTYGNGESSKDKFSIGKPSLIGISGVDGEGTLGKDLSGSAEWLMIPYSTAAPQEDTLYDVGGRLSYRVGGSNFSVPLLPDTITVKPNPSLVVHYFHESIIDTDHFIDDLDDFLVNDVVDSNAMPDKLYNSQNGSDVYDVYTGHISQFIHKLIRAIPKQSLYSRTSQSNSKRINLDTRTENNITSAKPC
ncbi:unnamed protein product [Mytilus edulis]|uniref:Uncharacterized protein n=1 Tax=Mytilus edulis TaxID=6550 RepID=A0A8S3UVW0_MYTED|nr:unnamed protein product [Mytilus edulis]